MAAAHGCKSSRQLSIVKNCRSRGDVQNVPLCRTGNGPAFNTFPQPWFALQRTQQPPRLLRSTLHAPFGPKFQLMPDYFATRSTSGMTNSTPAYGACQQNI